MKKTITTWLAGAAVGRAFAGALPATAQDTAPAAAAPVATAQADTAQAEAAAPAAALVAAATVPEAAPAAAPAPTPHKGDTAWMFVATIMVMLMTIPGLALYYGGLVRTKNMLSVLMQVFMVFALIIVLWCLYGYSLAFTPGSAFIGK